MKTLKTVLATAFLLMASTVTAKADEFNVQRTGGGVNFGFNVGSPGLNFYYDQGGYGPYTYYGPRPYRWNKWRHRNAPYAYGNPWKRGSRNYYGGNNYGHPHKKFRKGFRKGYRQGFRDGAYANPQPPRRFMKRSRRW